MCACAHLFQLVTITFLCQLYSTNSSSPRTELLININNLQRRGSERPGSPFDVRMTAGLRMDNWKLLTGSGGSGKSDY